MGIYILLGGSVVVVVVVVVDIVVDGVVLIGNLFLLFCHGPDGYLGAIVGIIGVGGKVTILFQFVVVGHLSGLGLCQGFLVCLVTTGGGLVTTRKNTKNV